MTPAPFASLPLPADRRILPAVTQRTCTVDDCDRAHRARGLCIVHYSRRYGRKGGAG